MRMIFTGYRIPIELKKQAQAKARPNPLAAIIRALIEMWVRGEIEIDWDKVAK